jgi:glutathione peroxidase
MRHWLSMLALLGVFMSSSFAEEKGIGESVLNHKLNSLDGKEVDLGEYKGKVLLIVNVASQCGLTPQYKGLQAMYEKYKDKGLVVMGFPCNQFGSQEPGSAKEISQFCQSKYDVTFPMFEKIEVNGAGATPLYKQLTSLDTEPKGSGNVTWNFEKFLVGRDGKVVARFTPRTAPDDQDLVAAVEKLLAAE